MQVCTSLQTDNPPGTHHSVFYRPDALPAAQPTASKPSVLSLHSPITLTANTSKIAYSCQISDYMTKTKNMPDPI